MNAAIRPFDVRAEFLTQERCWIVENWNAEADPTVSIARARLEPGVATQLHRLRGVCERYVVVTGTGLVRLADQPQTRVAPGDVVIIPPDTPQRLTNDGPADLIFYCICTPRFTPACYDALPE